MIRSPQCPQFVVKQATNIIYLSLAFVSKIEKAESAFENHSTSVYRLIDPKS